MQTLKKSNEKGKKEKSKETEASTKKLQDEKHKKSAYSVTTPRNYIPKSSTADIYGHKNNTDKQAMRAPRKVSSSTHNSDNSSPMRELLKSSSSSVSVGSKSSNLRFNKVETKSTPRKAIRIDTPAMTRTAARLEAMATPRTPKIIESKSTSQGIRKTSRRDLPFSNVTVSSPPVKRKLNLDQEFTDSDNTDLKLVSGNVSSKTGRDELPVRKSNKESSSNNSQLVFERQRTKTRTLDEDEVKMLTPDVMDNNTEMINLSRKLVAKPKGFFVDLEDEKKKNKKEEQSEEEVSYEDDFESYESDFESYHSESPGDNDTSSNDTESSQHGDESNDDDVINDGHGDASKEARDEERMLDSGSYDLRDRSAKNKPSIMEGILEDNEDGEDKKISLPDEGFQEMSSSSAVSSLRNVHMDVLERPLFIDFKKSKEVKRKRRIFERLKKRAEDLLAMISLHEMTYSLFEMKPISYDLYIATFGRQNYIQTAVQTFDDGISEEVQCDEIMRSHKWTQNPVEFSKSDVYLSVDDTLARKCSVVTGDYLTKFSFMSQQNQEKIISSKMEMDENYKQNPLRIYFEQKDGAGSSEMLPMEKYKVKLKNKKYDSHKLGKFLKKIESRVSNVLSLNTGHTKLDLMKSTKIPFSKGYVSLSIKNIANENYEFLRKSNVVHLFFSETKGNLLMTVHNVISMNKYLICLWDASMANREAAKILIAIDNIVIGRFRGGSDGILVAALEDGTLHLWDLSEEPTYIPPISDEIDTDKLVEVKSDHLTEFEKDREWNLKNINVKNQQHSDIHCALQACAYTNCAHIMSSGEVSDQIVGLEFTSPKSVILEGGRKIVGQVVSLQRIGILVTWTIVQEKNKTNSDIGKAYWSKMKLEKLQTVNLHDYVESVFTSACTESVQAESFNLNLAKKRLTSKKQDRSVMKLARQKSAGKKASVVSATSRKDPKMLPYVFSSDIICTDLKIFTVDDIENVLVAKNCGEVLYCKRRLGVFKVQRFSVTNEASSVTSLQVSQHGLPHFLAATDTGTVNLCSLLENKVLLTLDGRNVPPARESSEKYYSDAKGRFVGSASVLKETPAFECKEDSSKMSVTSLFWSQVNPCCIYAVLKDGTFVAWDLANSDIYAKTAGVKAQIVAAGESTVAILTSDEEVQIHKFNDEQRSKEYLELFKKYVALL